MGTSCRISAQMTVSWTKFLGTPPPIMRRPEVGAAILISVSSRKSFTESMETWLFGCRCWCSTRPNPALESEKAGQKIGTSFS